MKNTVPSGGFGANPRDAAPAPASPSSGFLGTQDRRTQRMDNGLESLMPRVQDLLRSAVQPIAPPLTRALRDLAYSYVPAQGLGGSLHFDESMPDIDVADGPLHAILEHLVEGALRGNPNVKPYCHVGTVEDNEEHVVLAVRDNGTPLPQCDMAELRRFLRDTDLRHVPDRVHRLLLADNLVQWLGGRISIAPTPGADGTTILLEIPRDHADPSAGQSLVGRHVF